MGIVPGKTGIPTTNFSAGSTSTLQVRYTTVLDCSRYSSEVCDRQEQYCSQLSTSLSCGWWVVIVWSVAAGHAGSRATSPRRIATAQGERVEVKDVRQHRIAAPIVVALCTLLHHAGRKSEVPRRKLLVGANISNCFIAFFLCFESPLPLLFRPSLPLLLIMVLRQYLNRLQPLRTNPICSSSNLPLPDHLPCDSSNAAAPTLRPSRWKNVESSSIFSYCFCP